MINMTIQDKMLNAHTLLSYNLTSKFNNPIESIIVSGAGLFLNAKEKIDAMLGDELVGKIHSAIEKILLLF